MPVTRPEAAKLKSAISDWSRGPSQSSETVRTERRSATRPTIIESWRKTLSCDVKQTPVRSQKNAPIDVWLTHIQSFIRAQSCLALLTEDDRTSLTQLQSPASRISATAARVLLRLALSRAVRQATAPSEWKFEAPPTGKPVVGPGLPNIKFSVSHIDQLVVVAVSPNLNIGIDVESVDQSLSPDLITTFCHSDEQHSLKRLPESQRTREFIRLWTLKEAYTKLIGTGHSVDFTWIKFMLDPVNFETRGDVPAKRAVFENFHITARHSLYHVSLAVELSPHVVLPTEVQIISLADPAGLEEAVPAPIAT